MGLNRNFYLGCPLLFQEKALLLLQNKMEIMPPQSEGGGNFKLLRNN